MENDENKKVGVMNRLNKIGEGSYGVVYSANFKDDASKKVYAVKRNFKEHSATWFGNLHEIDILIRLKGHPFIVDIHRICMGDPFDQENCMSPSANKVRNMSEDKFHFVLEYVSTSGDSYLKSKNFSFVNSKIILTQVAIALEYMHSKYIIHRDLKPANILMDFKDNIAYSKLCDFGMSCNYIKAEAKTPGVVTCWYRAPEICFGHKDYDYKSDIWSFGCLMYEFISKEPWLAGTCDDDTKIINTIFAKLETPPLAEDINYLTSKATKRINYITRDNMKRRLTYESQLNLRVNQKMEFEKYCGPLNLFLDLMRKCLQINPEKRIGIKDILNHSFFDFYRVYISNIRNAYVNNKVKNDVVINNYIERRWAVNLALNIYNNRSEYKWYSHILLFHSLNIFERFMDWALKENNQYIELNVETNNNQGKLYNKEETELRFWICMYIMHKYYSTLVHPQTWETFCPESYRKGKNVNQIAEDFEYRLVKYACNFAIYQDTLYEYADRKEKLDEMRIAKILEFYSRIDNYIGDLESLYVRYVNDDSMKIN